jgi:hypothetical protein
MPLARQRLLSPAIRRPCVLAALRNGIFISMNDGVSILFDTKVEKLSETKK